MLRSPDSTSQLPDPMRHVWALAGEIGARPSTGTGELRAARYLQRAMAKWADAVRFEPFQSYTTFSWPWLLIYSTSAAAGALAWSHPVVAAALGCAGVVAFLLESLGRLHLGAILPHRPSQNVIGLLRAAAEVRRRVVVVAHYDTTRSSPLWAPGMVQRFRTTFLLAFASAAVIPLLALAAVWWPAHTIWRLVILLPAANLLASALFLLHRELFCVYVPGANDNASGVAAAQGAAEALAARRPCHTEVWVACTGCEEVGMTGAAALLRAHPHDLQQALFVVPDNLGLGTLKYTLGEGMLRVRPCDPYLIKVARAVATRHPEWGVGESVNRLLPTDMEPALVQELPAIGLRAEDQRGLLPHWHWVTDVVENVDPVNINRAAQFIAEMVWQIDADA